MNVDEMFDVDPESGSSRLEFEFTGASQYPVSLDPAEFRGLSMPTITDSIMVIMSGIAPGVSFMTEDVELAAEAIKETNGEPVEHPTE